MYNGVCKRAERVFVFAITSYRTAMNKARMGGALVCKLEL
jgi:hypothetical protein